MKTALIVLGWLVLEVFALLLAWLVLNGNFYHD